MQWMRALSWQQCRLHDRRGRAVTVTSTHTLVTLTVGRFSTSTWSKLKTRSQSPRYEVMIFSFLLVLVQSVPDFLRFSTSASAFH